MTVAIRLATIDDAPRIAEIYKPYVENTAVTFEYEAPCAEEIARRIENVSKRYPWYVAECNGEVMGYAYAGTFKGRSAYDWSVETSIYVDKNHRGGGLGSKLYFVLEEALKEQGVRNMYACIAYVDEPDEYLGHGSVDFHSKLGFELIGTFHKCAFKFGRWYHMRWMGKFIGPHDDDPKFIPYPEI